jgi:hypothetical protein
MAVRYVAAAKDLPQKLQAQFKLAPLSNAEAAEVEEVEDEDDEVDDDGEKETWPSASLGSTDAKATAQELLGWLSGQAAASPALAALISPSGNPLHNRASRSAANASLAAMAGMGL